MASKRKLKKTINFVSDEVILEIYVLSLFKEIKEEKLDELVDKTLEIRSEFIQRMNHVPAKENSKIVRDYFKKLREDWANAIDGIAKDVEKL